MALGFSSNFNASDFKNGINIKLERINLALVQLLKDVGMQAVIDAKSVDTYKDRTGNLRNSISSGVARYGRLVEPPQNEGATGAGAAIGDAMVDGLIDAKKEYSHALVVVAGMAYAPYVEALNYDVLTGAVELAKENIAIAIKEFQSKIQGS